MSFSLPGRNAWGMSGAVERHTTGRLMIDDDDDAWRVIVYTKAVHGHGLWNYLCVSYILSLCQDIGLEV